MENLRKKLEKIGRLDRAISRKNEQMNRLKEMAENVSISYSDRVQTSNVGDRVSNMVNKRVDISFEIDIMIDELVDLKRELLNLLDRLEDERFIDVLYKRYFEYKSWDDISEDMGYSKRQVQRWHGYALLVLNKVCRDLS